MLGEIRPCRNGVSSQLASAFANPGCLLCKTSWGVFADMISELADIKLKRC